MFIGFVTKEPLPQEVVLLPLTLLTHCNALFRNAQEGMLRHQLGGNLKSATPQDTSGHSSDTSDELTALTELLQMTALCLGIRAQYLHVPGENAFGKA